MSERQTGAMDDEVPWSTEPTTGATEDQIEQGAINAWGGDLELPTWRNAREEDKYPIRADARWWAGNLVPPGQVITDAARVPTDDELAEWRRLVGGADEGYVDLPSLDVLRAYLERQR